MIQRNRSLGTLVVTLLAGALAAWSPAREPDPALAAAAGTEGLAWGLVRASGAGNAIVSPVSVWEALAMTHAGARGDTAAEIAEVLGMPDDRAAIGVAAAALRESLAAAKGEKVVLDVANRLWVQKGKKLEAEFTGLLADRFGAAAGDVDFAGATEAARGEINRWVSDQTAKKIDELLKPGILTPLTRLVLTNAVYMKAPWATPFDSTATVPEPFTLATGEAVDVPFMHRTARLTAGQAEVAGQVVTICEIPYDAGGQLAMVVIVPAAADALSAVLAGLDGRTLWNWQRGGGTLRPRQVRLAVPKWKARKALGLNAALADMGMKKAFAAGAADFSGIDGTRDLFVSAVVHEGFVEVSEEGTEAAAATGVVVGVRSAAPPQEEPLEVRADRPFAWAVVQQGTGAVLFAGVVADPR